MATGSYGLASLEPTALKERVATLLHNDRYVFTTRSNVSSMLLFFPALMIVYEAE